ncbi:MAG TPA: hypothetical protein VGS61_02000, partial [Acidimicrobiales bacterium]|nr:hypothetical protein [Acidimicrobiales bacterium]
NEYYLTDVAAELRDAGHRVDALPVEDAVEASGVNDRAQLAVAEAALRARINEGWMRAGVTMYDPASTYVDVAVELSPEVTLLPGVMLLGSSVVEPGAVIGPFARLEDTRVGERARVGSAQATRAHIGADAVVGAHCVLEPGAAVAPGATVRANEVLAP